MGELFYALNEIYPRYIDPGQTMMKFEQFLNFTRDHDIFPKLCSKAALHRIFHSLALMSEAMSPSRELLTTRSNLEQNSVSVMSPHGQALTQSLRRELIDENLFVEALTLCAFFTNEPNKELRDRITAYDPLTHEEPDKKSLRVFLTQSLSLVEVMNKSDGVFSSINDKHRTGVAALKCSLQDKKDLMAGFRSNPKFKWYFQMKRQTPKRFHSKNLKLDFDSAMKMDSILQLSQT
jgi:hypothetical protein